jgi:hypothetical protein
MPSEMITFLVKAYATPISIIMAMIRHSAARQNAFPKLVFRQGGSSPSAERLGMDIALPTRIFRSFLVNYGINNYDQYWLLTLRCQIIYSFL